MPAPAGPAVQGRLPGGNEPAGPVDGVTPGPVAPAPAAPPAAPPAPKAVVPAPAKKAAVRTDIPSLRYIRFSVTIAKIQIMRDKVLSSSGITGHRERRQAPGTSPSVIPYRRNLASPAGPTITLKVFIGPARAFKLVLAGIAPKRTLLKGLARPPKPFAEQRSKIIRLRYFWAVPGPAIFACCLAMISAGIT